MFDDEFKSDYKQCVAETLYENNKNSFIYIRDDNKICNAEHKFVIYKSLYIYIYIYIV